MTVNANETRAMIEGMLEEGTVIEGAEVYSEEISIPADGSMLPPDGTAYEDGDVVVFTQKSDASSELLGNAITFLIALGGSFAGGKIKERRNNQKPAVQ